MEKKVFSTFKEAIKSFNNLKTIKLIGTFSKIKKKKAMNQTVDDIDIIIISTKKTHDKFMEHFSNLLKRRKLKPYIFEGPPLKLKKSKKEVFIHDYNYRGLRDLKIRGKNRKTVINTIKVKTKVLYGDKNILKNIPLYKVSKEELVFPILRWARKLSSQEQFNVLKRYLLKETKHLADSYPYLELSSFSKIPDILKRNLKWKKARREIIALMEN